MTTTLSRNLAAWKTFFERVTHAASDALSLWTNGQVAMSLGGIQEASLSDVAGILHLTNDSTTITQIGIDGEYSGELILTFDDTNGRAFLRALLSERVVTSHDWSPLEISAFAETGNIIASIYLNYLSDLTGRRLWPTPPHVTRDFPISIVEQALMYQALESDRVLVFETCFECKGRQIQWNLVFVPSPELLGRIEEMLNR